MANLKKFNSENHIHFVTFKTFGKIEVKNDQKYYEGYPYFKDERCCSMLIEEFNFYREKLGFKVFGYVIMPNHIHMLIWWDIGEKPELTIGKIVGEIKEMSSKRVKKYWLHEDEIVDWIDNFKAVDPFPRVGAATSPHLPAGTSTNGFKFWQKGYYDFNIFSLEKYQEKLNYIHNNPVRAKIVEKPEDYKWSSYRSLYLNDYSVLKVDQIDL